MHERKSPYTHFAMDSYDAYVVEQPGFFAAYLVKTLARAHLRILRVNETIDFGYLRKRAPDVVFVDPDYLALEATRTVRVIRRCAPESLICLYTSCMASEWSRACFTAGANAIVTKYASDSEIVAGVRVALRVGTYADPRLGESCIKTP